jgi:hypothetical protein
MASAIVETLGRAGSVATPFVDLLARVLDLRCIVE